MIDTNILQSKSSLGVYVHIPFCKSRCIYCDFVSSIDDCGQRQKYVEYLCRQIELSGKEYSENYIVDTLYFGGGTPTILDKEQLKRISSCIFDNFKCQIKEFSIEANPCTIDREKLIALKDMGVTRLSLGVQSLNDNLLKMLGRRHDAECAERAISLAIQLGFDVSVDAMIGLPNQTKDDIKYFVDRISQLGVEHISVYMLSVEEGTKLKSMIEQGKLIAKTDDELADLYEYSCDILKKCGYDRYEISNFCKNNKVSYHNLRYWKHLDYLGLGMGAHSLTAGVRWCNADNFADYFASIESGDYRRDIQVLSKEEKQNEYIMLAFRLKNGIDLQEFSSKFGCDFLSKYSHAIEKNKNYLEISKDKIAIKYDYLQLMNSIIVDFL